MYVHWQSLLCLGSTVWVLSFFGDLLGDSTWKNLSFQIDDILRRQQNNFIMPLDASQKTIFTLASLAYNILTFTCSLAFFFCIKPLFWILCKLFNHYRKKGLLSNYFMFVKKSESNLQTNNNSNSKVIYENKSYSPPLLNLNYCKETDQHCEEKVSNKQVQKIDEFTILEKKSLLRELSDVRREKNDLIEKILVLQKENNDWRRKYDNTSKELKTIREKVEKNDLKDLDIINHEAINKKTVHLESHLEEVKRDRDVLQKKLTSMERNYYKLKENLELCQMQQMKAQVPEKDNSLEKETFEPLELALELDFRKYQNLGKASNFSLSERNLDSPSKTSLDDQISIISKDSAVDESNLWKDNTSDRRCQKEQNWMGFPVLHAGLSSVSLASSDETHTRRSISGNVEFQNLMKNMFSPSSINLGKSD